MTGPDALARAAADWIVACLTEATGTLAVALSGGSTPKRLYALLATDEFAAKLPWERVHWFWGDERFVPPDDPSSNYRMAQETMLHLAPAGNVHPVPTVGVTPEESAAGYERTLRAFHASADVRAPLFQVVLLGLGTNGHFASLFPDTASLAERGAWAVPVTPAGEKTRITLTYPALENCRHAGFLVSGADKRDVLARVRAGAADLPASNYRPEGELRWFADDPAVGR